MGNLFQASGLYERGEISQVEVYKGLGKFVQSKLKRTSGIKGSLASLGEFGNRLVYVTP